MAAAILPIHASPPSSSSPPSPSFSLSLSLLFPHTTSFLSILLFFILIHLNYCAVNTKMSNRATQSLSNFILFLLLHTVFVSFLLLSSIVLSSLLLFSPLLSHPLLSLRFLSHFLFSSPLFSSLLFSCLSINIGV